MFIRLEAIQSHVAAFAGALFFAAVMVAAAAPIVPVA